MRRVLTGALALDDMRGATLDASGIDQRLQTLEDSLSDVRRRLVIAEERARIAALSVNAAVDLYEHRIDLIYRQIVRELGRTLADGAIAVETDDSIDDRLSELFSAGLRVPVDPSQIDLRVLLSEDLFPGVLQAPLTFYGFRIDRRLAREAGDAIEVAPSAPDAAGAAVYGPYRKLAPGRYQLRLALAPLGAGSAGKPVGKIVLDVYNSGADKVVAQVSSAVKRLPDALVLDFEWHEFEDLRVEFRVHQRSNVAFRVLSIELERRR